MKYFSFLLGYFVYIYDNIINNVNIFFNINILKKILIKLSTLTNMKTKIFLKVIFQ